MSIFIALVVVKIIVGVGLIFYAGYLGNTELVEDLMETEMKTTGAITTTSTAVHENNMNFSNINNNNNNNNNSSTGTGDVDRYYGNNVATTSNENSFRNRSGSGSNITKERRAKQASSISKLSDIERYTVLKSRGGKSD